MDVLNGVKTVLIAGLEEVPYVGKIYGLLLEELWPDDPEQDPWAEIKERVEALIDQKLSDEVYQNVTDSLTGLQSNSQNFFDAVTDPARSAVDKSEEFVSAKASFNVNAAHFREKGYELLLLPLLAQMANLHLTLLREGCLHCKDWGFTDADRTALVKELATKLSEYVAHVDAVYDKGLRARSEPVDDFSHLATFNRKYGFIREMTVSVLDYRRLWPFMNPAKYPNPVRARLSGEIYSDAYGSLQFRQPPEDPRPLDYREMTRIQVWAGTKVDALKPWYGGLEQPKAPPDSKGGWIQGDFDLGQTGRPTSFCVYPHDALWGLGLWFENGTSTLMGFYGHPDDPGDRNRDPISPPDGYEISGITAIGPDLVRAIYFRYRYSNQSPADTSAVLAPGTEFPKDKLFSSSNGVATLVFQSDGNLVIYDENKLARWSSDTYDKGDGRPAGVRCVYEGNGDLCVYDKDSQVLWHSNTRGHPGPPTRLPGSLRVQPDGDVVIYNQAGEAKWSAKTKHAYDTLIRPGTELLEGVPFSSSNTAANLVFQSDGNLVVYDENRQPRWAVGTKYDRWGRRCVFEKDGDLVVYSDPAWDSNTKAHPEAVLAVQADGDVVIYDKDGGGRTPLWSTQTAH